MTAKPRLGLLQLLEFAGPLDAIAGRQLHVLRDSLLRLRNRARRGRGRAR